MQCSGGKGNTPSAQGVTLIRVTEKLRLPEYTKFHIMQQAECFLKYLESRIDI